MMVQYVQNPRPYVILNTAMTLCGHIASKTGDTRLSSYEDWIRVHKLRASVDAIMVGLNTILADDSKLTIKPELVGEYKKRPHRIVVDSLARTPPSARILHVSPETPTTIAITSRAPLERVERLKSRGADIKVCGDKSRVDLSILMQYLKEEKNINKLMLEGGGTLNWAMLNEKLIDEIIVAIAPVIVGNGSSISIFEGEGFEKMSDSPLLQLKKYEEVGDCFLLSYQVLYFNNRY